VGELRFNTASVGGTVRNLSSGGLAVASSAGLRVGRRYSLSVSSPTRRVRLQATVRWSTLQRTRRTACGDILPEFVAGLSLS
jgi:hypothetical protein